MYVVDGNLGILNLLSKVGFPNLVKTMVAQKVD